MKVFPKNSLSVIAKSDYRPKKHGGETRLRKTNKTEQISYRKSDETRKYDETTRIYTCAKRATFVTDSPTNNPYQTNPLKQLPLKETTN